MVIEEMWHIYDDDGNGELDYDETKQFIKDSLKAMTNEDCFNEKTFLRVYRILDTDGNGKINKEEMKLFLKNLISEHGWSHNDH